MPHRSTGGARRPVVTGRALVLGALIILLVVVLASPVRRYLGSRSDVGAAAAQLRHDTAQRAQLQRQKALWSDPGYIQRQARTRLQLAMPGDTVYTVVHHAGGATVRSHPVNRARAAGDSWNTRLWDSVRAAGQ